MPHTPMRIAFRYPWPGTRRGLVLWLLCIAVILVGVANYIGTTLPDRTERALAPMLDVLPSTEWGWVFVLVGLVAGFFSYCHYNRDHIGYALMTGLTGFWGAAWVIGFFFDWGNGGPPDWRILGGAAIWIAFAAVLFVCRGFERTPLYPGSCP